MSPMLGQMAQQIASHTACTRCNMYMQMSLRMCRHPTVAFIRPHSSTHASGGAQMPLVTISLSQKKILCASNPLVLACLQMVAVMHIMIVIGKNGVILARLHLAYKTQITV